MECWLSFHHWSSVNGVKKVFVVGLSRTGTTSITEALNILEFEHIIFAGKWLKSIATGVTIKYLDHT